MYRFYRRAAERYVREYRRQEDELPLPNAAAMVLGSIAEALLTLACLETQREPRGRRRVAKDIRRSCIRRGRKVVAS